MSIFLQRGFCQCETFLCEKSMYVATPVNPFFLSFLSEDVKWEPTIGFSAMTPLWRSANTLWRDFLKEGLTCSVWGRSTTQALAGLPGFLTRWLPLTLLTSKGYKVGHWPSGFSSGNLWAICVCLILCCCCFHGQFKNLFINLLIYLYGTGGAWWHLQKCLHCILVTVTPPSFSFIPPPLFLEQSWQVSLLHFHTYVHSTSTIHAFLHPFLCLPHPTDTNP
jgi:hypothetical protein